MSEQPQPSHSGRRRRRRRPPEPVAPKFTTRKPVFGTFGILAIQQDAFGKRTRLDVRFGRLAVVGFSVSLLAYATVVGVAYGWLRWHRHIDGVTIGTVASLDTTRIRARIGSQQFDQSTEEWDQHHYSDAYLHLLSAVRNAPRLAKARVFLADLYLGAGSVPQAIATLDNGLALEPEDPQLTDRLVSLLIAYGKPEEALRRLRHDFAPQLGGDREALLRTYELVASLSAEGVQTARRYLADHPVLLSTPEAQPTVAEVLWRSGEREEAEARLTKFLSDHPDRDHLFAMLVDYQMNLGHREAAQATAATAIQRSPLDPGAYLMAVATRGPEVPGEQQAWNDAIKTYIAHFGTREPELLRLARLAGTRGWASLCHFLYTGAVSRGDDPMPFALAYCQTLVLQKKYTEAWAELSSLAPQVSQRSPYRATLLELELVAADQLKLTDALPRLVSDVRITHGGRPKAIDAMRVRLRALGATTAADALTPPPPPKKDDDKSARSPSKGEGHDSAGDDAEPSAPEPPGS